MCDVRRARMNTVIKKEFGVDIIREANLCETRLVPRE